MNIELRHYSNGISIDIKHEDAYTQYFAWNHDQSYEELTEMLEEVLSIVTQHTVVTTFEDC